MIFGPQKITGTRPNPAMLKTALTAWLCLLCSVPIFAVQANAAQETVCWVFFRDKGPNVTSRLQELKARRSGRARARKARQYDSTDLPVYPAYLDTVRALGLRIRNQSRWLNAVSAVGEKSLFSLLQARPFVSDVKRIARLRSGVPVPVAPIPKRSDEIPETKYGPLYPYLDMIEVPLMHDYLADRGKKPGEGIRIAVFDAGFDIGHPCLSKMRKEGRLVGDSDFVEQDGDVWPNRQYSIPGQSDASGDSLRAIDHGTGTLSLIAAFSPDTLIGVAPFAEFVLARTEEVREERHLEEDNWVAALEWAESLDVDIVSSSVAYRYDFTDSGDGYTQDQMNGETALISRAAAEGVRKGMIIINSIGNEQKPNVPSTLSAPADVEGVIAVGAVDHTGSITGFSSEGPTADGRIKPDVVAPGAFVYRAVPGGGYNSNSGGTSFSAPLVSGCAALLKQLHPQWGPDDIQSKLRATASRSDKPNSTYGWGIARVLSAEMDSFSIYGGIYDSASGKPLENAQVILGDNSDTCVTGESGGFSFRLLASGDQYVWVKKPGWILDSLSFSIPKYPAGRMDALLQSVLDSSLIMGIAMTRGNGRLRDVNVDFEGPTSGQSTTDHEGVFVISGVEEGVYRLSLFRKGYQTRTLRVTVPIDSVIEIVLDTITFANMAVYPIPCRKGRVVFEFFAEKDYVGEDYHDLRIELFTLDGYLVRIFRRNGIKEGEAVRVIWDDLSLLRSGIYYAFVEFGPEAARLKLPILNP